MRKTPNAVKGKREGSGEVWKEVYRQGRVGGTVEVGLLNYR